MCQCAIHVHYRFGPLFEPLQELAQISQLPVLQINCSVVSTLPQKAADSCLSPIDIGPIMPVEQSMMINLAVVAPAKTFSESVS